MDSKRFLLALALSVAVIFGVQMIYPGVGASNKQGKPNPLPAESSSTTVKSASSNTGAVPAIVHGDSIPATMLVKADTTIVMSHPDNGAKFVMSNVGAAPVSVVMNAYENRSQLGGKVDLASQGQPLIRYQAVVNQAAPVDVSGVPFSTIWRGDTLTYQASVTGKAIAIRYTFAPDSYSMHVTGTVMGAGDKSYLIVRSSENFCYYGI